MKYYRLSLISSSTLETNVFTSVGVAEREFINNSDSSYKTVVLTEIKIAYDGHTVEKILAVSYPKK